MLALIAFALLFPAEHVPSRRVSRNGPIAAVVYDSEYGLPARIFVGDFPPVIHRMWSLSTFPGIGLSIIKN
jgi:hypothetical protein